MTDKILAVKINGVPGVAKEILFSKESYGSCTQVEVKGWEQFRTPSGWKDQMASVLVEIQVRHSTQYEGIADRLWEWRCTCGLREFHPDRDACHVRTREHWAQLMLEAFERVHFEIKGLVEQVAESCPCGARPESPGTHPHVTGCPVAQLVFLLGAKK